MVPFLMGRQNQAAMEIRERFDVTRLDWFDKALL